MSNAEYNLEDEPSIDAPPAAPPTSRVAILISPGTRAALIFISIGLVIVIYCTIQSVMQAHEFLDPLPVGGPIRATGLALRLVMLTSECMIANLILSVLAAVFSTRSLFVYTLITILLFSSLLPFAAGRIAWDHIIDTRHLQADE